MSAPVSQQPKAMLNAGDPGTFSHIASNAFVYSFKARMVGTGLMNQPPGTDSGYRPTGCAMCCCNMCPVSMCCCTGKVG